MQFWQTKQATNYTFKIIPNITMIIIDNTCTLHYLNSSPSMSLGTGALQVGRWPAHFRHSKEVSTATL